MQSELSSGGNDRLDGIESQEVDASSAFTYRVANVRHSQVILTIRRAYII